MEIPACSDGCRAASKALAYFTEFLRAGSEDDVIQERTGEAKEALQDGGLVNSLRKQEEKLREHTIRRTGQNAGDPTAETGPAVQPQP